MSPPDSPITNTPLDSPDTILSARRTPILHTSTSLSRPSSGTALGLAAHAEYTLARGDFLSSGGGNVLPPFVEAPPPASELAAGATQPASYSFDSTPERFKPPAARYGMFGSPVEQPPPTTEKGLTRAAAAAPGLPEEGSGRRSIIIQVAPPPRRLFQVFLGDQPPFLFDCSFSTQPLQSFNPDSLESVSAFDTHLNV